MRLFQGLLPLCGWLALSSASFGSTILVNPPTQAVPAGTVAVVRLGFSNLADLVPRALGAYDLQLSYDPALLRLDAVHFGDPLYGDQLDLSGFGTWSLSDATIPGMVRVLELSFDDASLLNSEQRRHFGLASLFFQAQSAGTSPLTVQVNMLADASGFAMEGSTVNGSVTVTPEPGMFVLAGTGLSVLAVWRRKRRPVRLG